MSRHHLDARRLLCPLPVIRTQDVVAGLGGGEELEVVCTDPGAEHDIPTWCRVHGHTVMETHFDGDEIVILIRVGESN